MRCRSGFTLGLQENWRIGKNEITEDNFIFSDQDLTLKMVTGRAVLAFF
jgi:hypothetical protein